MSYRPYYTNTQIDGQALNGAIKGIGGLFGKGKMTATQGEDPITKRPTMNYSTSGGNFWDNVNGQQAQRANLAAQGLGFKTDMDLYQNQGDLKQKVGFNSQDRINQFTDKARIAKMIQDNAGGNSDFYNAQSILQKNELAEAQAFQSAAQKGLLHKQIEDIMAKQGIINRSVQAGTEGQLGENQFQQRSMDPRLTSMQLGNQAARQSIDQSRDLHPYNIDRLSYGNMLANKEVQNYDALQAAKIRNLDEVSGGSRYVNVYGLPGVAIDRITGEAIEFPMEPNFEESESFGYKNREQKGLKFNPKGKFNRYSLGSNIPQATGTGGTNSIGMQYTLPQGTNAPSRRISREQLDKILGK